MHKFSGTWASLISNPQADISLKSQEYPSDLSLIDDPQNSCNNKPSTNIHR